MEPEWYATVAMRCKDDSGPDVLFGPLLAEDLISPLAFAQTFCQDLELPSSHVDTIVNMIRAQLDEHSGIATMDIGGDENDPKREDPDCRVILRVGDIRCLMAIFTS